ncbi:MAG: GTP-binding protein, partial [Carboxydocellales bacterium]
CTLERDLVETVKAIVKQAGPEKLLIELIGIASPAAILTALVEAEGLPPLEFLPVIGVIDASNFEGNIYKEEFEKLYWDQIMNSDILLLNKMDLVDQEALIRAEHVLWSNSSAVIIPTSYCRVGLPDFLGFRRLQGTKRPNGCLLSGLSYHKVVVNGSFTEEGFSQFSERMARGDFGEILRAKGIIKIHKVMTVFQYVQGRLSLTPWQGEGKNRLVFIGWNVDGRKLDRDLIPYLKIDLEITDYAGPFGDMRQF